MLNTKKTLTALFGLSLLAAPLLGSAQAKGGVCPVVYYSTGIISECAPAATPAPDASAASSASTASNSNSNKPVKP